MKRKNLSLLTFWLAFLVFSAQAFSQPPLPDSLLSASSLIFYSLGDQGSGSDAQKQVADAMERESQRSGKPHFVLLLGDNFYPGGVFSVEDPQWNDKFEKIYRGRNLRKTPFFAVLGNHDHRHNTGAQVTYSRENLGSGRWRMPDRYYRLDLGRSGERPLMRLVGLDTTDTGRFNKQADFLRNSFISTDKEPLWKISAGHHPLFSAGSHRLMAEMHTHLLPAMNEAGVHLYLAGHDHNLQLISYPNRPIQIVSGGGGKSLYPIKRVDWGVRFAESKYGFVRVALTSQEMKMTFFDRKGRVLYEMIKSL
jgi:tartrate-resistant acid phosphatase type 5